jgi:hypothetical protein
VLGQVCLWKGGSADRLVFGLLIALSCLVIVCPTEDTAITAFHDDLNGHG